MSNHSTTVVKLFLQRDDDDLLCIYTIEGADTGLDDVCNECRERPYAEETGPLKEVHEKLHKTVSPTAAHVII